MSDWLGNLTPHERNEWDAFVEHFRRDALEKIDSSAFVMSLVPDTFDVKFAMELGSAIMMDKPILAVVMPGSKVTDKLRLVVDEIVECDVDTEEGREQIAVALRRMAERQA